MHSHLEEQRQETLLGTVVAGEHLVTEIKTLSGLGSLQIGQQLRQESGREEGLAREQFADLAAAELLQKPFKQYPFLGVQLICVGEGARCLEPWMEPSAQHLRHARQMSYD
jgi:hypothetical protein